MQHCVTESPIAKGIILGSQRFNFYFLTLLRGETYEELHGVWLQFFLCATRENTTCPRDNAVCFYSWVLPSSRGTQGWGGGTDCCTTLDADPFHQSRDPFGSLIGSLVPIDHDLCITSGTKTTSLKMLKDFKGTWNKMRISSDSYEKADRSNKERRLWHKITTIKSIDSL